ncbi:uncharacterized protein LOC135393348 [Ornithodoros turicata]|uniref:uncharacterized protein LOC135393348 n=1 Tax=Ornithodoros turicata TaxID=34597 RepID=UPI0031388317
MAKDRGYPGRPPYSGLQHPHYPHPLHHHPAYHPSHPHYQTTPKGAYNSAYAAAQTAHQFDGSSSASSSVHSGGLGTAHAGSGASAALVSGGARKGGRIPHGNNTTASNSGSSSKARTRRMRCLISLGLILPALAGVIGVVAWAVSAETVMATAPRENADPTARIQDRTLYDDRYDLNDFSGLPPVKAIPPPDVPSDDNRGGEDAINSLPILPAQIPQGSIIEASGGGPGEKPVYVVHFVVGDKDKNNAVQDTTTTTSTTMSTTSRATSAKVTSTTSTAMPSTPRSTTPKPTKSTTAAPSTSTLDPHSPEFADMLNRILSSASKDGSGRTPQFVVFAPLPDAKKDARGGFHKDARYEPSLPPKQSFLERPVPPDPPSSSAMHHHSEAAMPRLPIRPRDEYETPHHHYHPSYLPPQQVLTRRNGSNPNPFLPPPPPSPFQPNANSVQPHVAEPPQPGFQSVGGYSASYNPPPPNSDSHPPYNPPPPPSSNPYHPPHRYGSRHYDPVDAQRGLLHPSSESAAYPTKDRSGYEINAGDSHSSHGGHGKGITFTIGGGGGDHGDHGSHGYGVSPMGVIKNLFLPFLPKPKVNLNGRVVFGVVLEKGVGLGHNQHQHGHHHHAVAYHH